MPAQNFPQSPFGAQETQQTPYQSQLTTGAPGFEGQTQQPQTQQPQNQQPQAQQPQTQQRSLYQQGQVEAQPIAGQFGPLPQTLQGASSFPSLGAQASEMSTTQGPAIQTPGSELQPQSVQRPESTTGQQSLSPQRQSMEAQQTPAAAGEYERAVAPELRAAIDATDQLANVCEWAETRFAGHGAVGASRACEDVHDRAQEAVDFILRGSPFAASAVNELRATIRSATQELQQQGTPEAREIQQYAQQADRLLEASLPTLASGAGASV